MDNTKNDNTGFMNTSYMNQILRPKNYNFTEMVPKESEKISANIMDQYKFEIKDGADKPRYEWLDDVYRKQEYIMKSESNTGVLEATN